MDIRKMQYFIKKYEGLVAKGEIKKIPFEVKKTYLLMKRQLNQCIASFNGYPPTVKNLKRWC